MRNCLTLIHIRFEICQVCRIVTFSYDHDVQMLLNVINVSTVKSVVRLFLIIPMRIFILKVFKFIKNLIRCFYVPAAVNSSLY